MDAHSAPRSRAREYCSEKGGIEASY